MSAAPGTTRRFALQRQGRRALYGGTGGTKAEAGCRPHLFGDGAAVGCLLLVGNRVAGDCRRVLDGVAVGVAFLVLCKDRWAEPTAAPRYGVAIDPSALQRRRVTAASSPGRGPAGYGLRLDAVEQQFDRRTVGLVRLAEEVRLRVA